MARFATDFGEFAPGAGLPAGFSTSGDPALYSVADVAGGRALRIGPMPNGVVDTFMDAAGAPQMGEVYLRARWTNAQTESYFDAFPGWSNVPLGASLHAGDTRLRITPSGTEIRQGAAELVTNSSNATSALAGDYHIVLRYQDAKVYAALWAEGAAPSRAWNYILDAGLSAAGFVGFLTGQWHSTVVVLFLGVGTDGDDAPRTVAALAAPRRPAPAVGTADGVATLQAGTAAAATRFRVFELPQSARYTIAGAGVALDTGWLGSGETLWAGARTDREYGLEVTVRDAGGVESAPSFVQWFTTGDDAGRILEGLPGFDLYGHRSEGCSDGVPAPDAGGLIGGLTLVDLPPGLGVLIERAGGVLHPMVVSPFGGEYPSPIEANLEGQATLTLPADAVAVRVYSRPRRQQGNAQVQYTDLDAHRELLTRYVPEHGPQPGDEYRWTAMPAPLMPTGVVAGPTLDRIRFAADPYLGFARHTHTRWRMWSRFGACPTLVYDSGWSTDLGVHRVPLLNLPAGYSTFVTATFRDVRGVIGAASGPLVYRVPLALFYGAPSGGLGLQADFQTGTDEYSGTSSERRPDAISLDYLTAFSAGPDVLGDASLGLAYRAWKIRCENTAEGSTIYLSPSSTTVAETRAGAEGEWGPETVLFSLAGTAVLEMGAAFEQSGRSVVCLERATGAGGAPEVWLYWYDPRIPGFTLANLGAARNPRVLLDNPQNPAESDVLLFYISDPNDRLEMRQQNEFYAVPNATPIEGVADLYCEKVAFARDNRLHVILSVRDVAGGRYALAALESAPYPVQASDALNVSMGMASGRAVREGFAVQPDGAENTSDIDMLDVSHSFASVFAVDLLSVNQSVEELGVQLSFVSTNTVDFLITPPATVEDLDVRTSLVAASTPVYLLAPAAQGPEELTVQLSITSASVVPV